MTKPTHKTRLQWYKTLPEPIRTMAIENTDGEDLKAKWRYLSISLSTAFLWAETMQGGEFWKLVSSGEYKKALALLKKEKPDLYAKYVTDKPTKPDFKHDKENSPANMRIYFEQKKRLVRNANIIFNAMLNGRKINGVICAKGLLFDSNGKKVFIIEARKRFAEIRDYLRSIGIEVQTESAKNGLKSHYLLPADINKIKKALKIKK